jgi:hypothetical protein
MGTLYYGTGSQPVEIDDVLLGHVKVVATAKLRRNESFTLSWKHGSDAPNGRSTIWLQPSIPLRFTFESDTAAQLERSVLSDLMREANSTGGLVLDLAVDEVAQRTKPTEPAAEPAAAQVDPAAQPAARTSTNELVGAA